MSCPKACVFIGFDRPKIAEKTLRPLKDLPILYLFCDGPTETHPTCQKEYRILFEEIAKKRKSLKTEIWTPEKNYGPLQGPPTAFHWMLEKEKSGTIVEEDVLTTPQFHHLAQWALDTYQDDPNIIALSSGLPNSHTLIPTQVAKSNLLLVWGWATWYEKIQPIKIPDSPLKPIPKNAKLSLLEKLHYQRIARQLKKNPEYAWSPYIQRYILCENKQTLFPKYKLTQNLGIHPQARRSRGTPDPNPEIAQITPKEGIDGEKENKTHKLHPSENLKLFKKKHGNLLQEIRTQLAIRTRFNHWIRQNLKS
jgi:hypothetical protein